MNGFLEDLKGSFGILSNADVMSFLLRGLMFTLVISVIRIQPAARRGAGAGEKLLHTRPGTRAAKNGFYTI